MKIKVDSMAASVSVELKGDYTADELTELIQKLGDARAQIANDPDRPTEGTEYKVVADPPLWTFWGPHTSGNFILMTRHPEFGWRGVLMSPAIASQIGVYLNQYLAYHVAASAASAAAPTAEAATRNAPQGGSGGSMLH